MKTQEQGLLGENLAKGFLENEGYRFIESNFLRRVGEIDLIMLAPAELTGSDNVIVFVEVRYRATTGFGGALASIDWKKQRKLIRVANAWLQKNACSTQLARIDVITLEPVSTKAGNAQNCIDHCSPSGTHIWNGHRLRWIPNAVEEST